MPELKDDDIIKVIADLRKRVKILETGNLIVTLKLGDDGIFRVPRKAADPATATNGEIYYNTTTNKFRGYENGAWVNLV